MRAITAEEIIAFRRQLHANPELSEREQNTAAAIVERLAPTNPSKIVEGLGRMRTGILAIYESGKPGPIVTAHAAAAWGSRYDHCETTARAELFCNSPAGSPAT